MILDVVVLERVWPPAAAGDLLSQIGGWPNLPPDMAWPSIRFKDGSTASLDFLAQIDLSELPEVSQRALLPKTGTLYFFALSQSHVPLEPFGPDAARVLYYPGDIRDVPRRPPPADAGWNQDELGHTRGTAVEFRDTDAPRGELYPRCPIRAIALSAKERLPEPPRDPNYDHRKDNFPIRVEDALLLINFARNYFRENILPLSMVYAHHQPLKKELWPAFEIEHREWRERALAVRQDLLSLGRATLLNEDQRAPVRAIIDEADTLARKLDRHGMRLSWLGRQASMMALATLLLDDPAIPLELANEIESAQSLREKSRHRMLGPPEYGQEVEEDEEDDLSEIDEELLGLLGPAESRVPLLQLDSDCWGPRFCWGDLGQLTFWIAPADLEAGRFDRATAEIRF